MNPYLLIIGFSVGAFGVITCSTWFLSRCVSRWTINANLLAVSGDDFSASRHMTTVHFPSLRNRQQAVMNAVSEKRNKGWHYLGAEPVSLLESLRSWGGALRLHFVTQPSLPLRR